MFTASSSCSICRIFRAFGALMNAASEGAVRVTPPFKPYLEEKMWFALFWMRPLREFWRRELGEKYFLKLQEVIPYTWPLDPTPLPQHAVIPRLEIHDWREAGKLSQKERDLLIKVSGFSPLGWGSRGVVVGSDVPQANGKSKSSTRSRAFEQSPTIMQRFHKGAAGRSSLLGQRNERIKTMSGRVRLCPYYFVETERSNCAARSPRLFPPTRNSSTECATRSSFRRSL